MKPMMVAAALLLQAVGSAWSATSSGGSPAAGTLPDRVIRITDQTRYVNVMRFETIRFVLSDAQGRENNFDWRFDQFDRRVFPLSDIAPSGTLANRSVQVYIQRDPPSD